MKLLTTTGALIISSLFLCTNQQNDDFSISKSINSFSIKLLATTSNVGGNDLNLALSPLTVWSLLTIMSEGARDNTARQLETVLELPANKNAFRNSYKSLSAVFMQQNQGIKFDFSNAVFVNNKFRINSEFQGISTNIYNAPMMSIDFQNVVKAKNDINRYVAQRTRNRIPNLVTEDDIQDASIFLTSVLYFKGQWSQPFNKTATKREAFYDEKNNKIGEVNMMYQAGVFPFARMEEIKAHAVELFYGNQGMSMIIILPFKGETVSNVLNLLSKRPFSDILQTLLEAQKTFSEEETRVYLPKFSINSELNLNVVLDTMGIKDIFNSERADLTGIFDHYLHVSLLIQKAEIEINEEGTVASAAAGASVSYKTTAPTLKANRPFLYFIVDKSKRAIVFSGKYSKPNL